MPNIVDFELAETGAGLANYNNHGGFKHALEQDLIFKEWYERNYPNYNSYPRRLAKLVNNSRRLKKLKKVATRRHKKPINP